MFGFMNKSQDCYLKFNSYGIHPFETKSDMKEDKISMRVISFNIWMQWHWCVLWHIAICRNVAVWSHQIDLIFFHFGACRIELWELKVSFNHSRERDRKKMVDFLTESKYQSNGATKKNIHPATSFRMEWLCLMTYLIIESRINIEGAM